MFHLHLQQDIQLRWGGIMHLCMESMRLILYFRLTVQFDLIRAACDRCLPKVVISPPSAAIDQMPKRSETLFVMGGSSERKLLKLPLLHPPLFLLSWRSMKSSSALIASIVSVSTLLSLFAFALSFFTPAMPAIIPFKCSFRAFR